MNERIEAIVSGKVQMVMYRDFAVRKAIGLKIVGEAQNLRNGTVRIIAEGTRDALETYITKLEKGPVLARVEDVAVTWLPATDEYVSFSITR